MMFVPQCVVCRRGLVPGQPSSEGAVTLNVSRGWHACARCKNGAVRALGGAGAVLGTVLEERAPTFFQLAKLVYQGVTRKGVAHGA